MAITLIVGKPGSGKSYFGVSKLAQMVFDWADHDKREDEKFERELYTNIPLNVENFQKYLDINGRSNYIVEEKFHFLEEDFFYTMLSGRRVVAEWWEKLPNNALIVIDEVHQLMPSGGTGSKDYMNNFVNYCSTHRHKGHDLIFITQHPDNINRSVLNMASDVFHILNVKSRVIPFLGIPLADIDVIKEAWGCFRQFAEVLYGNYVGRSLKVQSKRSIVLLPEVFALYKSNVMQDEGGGDRPSLKLSRIGALLWFTKRHWYHLTIKAVLVYFAFSSVGYAFDYLPETIEKALLKDMDSVSVKDPDEQLEMKPSPVVPRLPVESVRPIVSSSPVRRAPPVDVKEEKELDFFNRSGVYIYGLDFIVTKLEGRVLVGDVFFYRGKSVVLDSVDYKNKKLGVSDVPSTSSITRLPSDSITDLSGCGSVEISEDGGDGTKISAGGGENFDDVR
ncbi:MAG: zonular occludens toxin domain-containing protein [Planctomycetia bacterium]|nr:zonular occludens toxin domain-containing protein [Planctomycetia bacterium]